MMTFFINPFKVLLRRPQYLLLAMVLFVALKGFGQQNTPEKLPQIKAAARAGESKILLRWAPNEPAAWQLLNKYGYKIDRVTLTRNGKVLDKPELINIQEAVLKPDPLPSWEQLVDEDPYAAIAAQAIYGETFELTDDYQEDIIQIINKSRELEQRFSFALFAADMSAVTAKKSALSYTDTQVKSGERYLYRVYSAAPLHIVQVDTGYVYIGLEDYEELVRPEVPKANFGDRHVILQWNKMNYADIYTAYEIERSSNGGKTFAPITNLPIISSESPKGMPSQYMYYTDSLPNNNHEYQYRIRGLTPFGEKGPYSTAVAGIGRDEIGANPAISAHKVINNNSVELSWFFDDRFNYQLESFTLSKARKANGQYEIVAHNIPADSRMVMDESPRTTNYYKITAVGKYGQEAVSMPYLVQLIDSIPPAIPVGLIGKIDTTGLVTLTWKANTEEDLRGYRVFRSNFKEEEFIQITVEPVSNTVFYDTIPVKAITEKVYYTVVAVDLHYNPSDFAEPVALIRPDLSPPVPPVFTQIEAKQEGIQLAWIPSSSTDVKDHLLYRKTDNDQQWKLIHVFNATDSVWLDMKVSPERYYQYTMIAVDQARLESKPSQPLGASPLNIMVRKGIGRLYYTQSEETKTITLGWEYGEPGVEHYLIFRADEESAMAPLESVKAGEKKFTDARVQQGKSYRYQVMAQFEDGSQSALSEEARVKVR